MNYLHVAVEEALRARGSTAPNPLVGALVVREGEILSSGYHHCAGGAHAEVLALDAVDARGATLYVTLEPCAHQGRQPACAEAVVRSGVVKVVIGVLDPNPLTAGAGARRLREAGIEVCVVDDARCARLIEDFGIWMTTSRPYLGVKMAMSIDGAIASAAEVQQWITGEAERAFVRDLRIAHDAVMVGARTARIDDPLLTVRPSHERVRPYVRIVACETAPIDRSRRVFAPVDGYARTIVLAPAGLRERFGELEAVAELVYVGTPASARLDLGAAMHALRERDICSILCEGGPTLAARLIAEGLADRFYWAIAPVLLSGPGAVPVLNGVDFAPLARQARFDLAERVGDDVLLSGRFDV